MMPDLGFPSGHMWSNLVKMTLFMRASRRGVTGAIAVTALAAIGVAAPPSSAGTALTGTFTINAGSCAGGVHGSYFRMIMHSGTLSGPFLSNSDSKCSKKTYTLLSPGSDGGLITGHYQKQASPAFDSSGNALSHRITKPTRFYGVNFATATNKVDPQTRKSVSPPQVTLNGTKLSADLRSFAVSWNNQQFNQGSPKPSGTRPGLTRAATGTYNAATGKYTLQWTSQIQGGPFDGFTGLWHLTGTFKPATQLSPAAQPAPASPSTTTPAAATRTRSHKASKPAASVAAVPPSVTPTIAAPSTVTKADAGVTHHTGSARWPWIVVAVAAITAVAGFAARSARTA